jgi:hypothetical protein
MRRMLCRVIFGSNTVIDAEVGTLKYYILRIVIGKPLTTTVASYEYTCTYCEPTKRSEEP